MIRDERGSIVLAMFSGVVMMMLVASIATYTIREATSIKTAMEINQAEYVADSGFELASFLIRDAIQLNAHLSSDDMLEREDGSWGFSDEDLIYLDFEVLKDRLEFVKNEYGNSSSLFTLHELIEAEIPDDYIAQLMRINSIKIEGYRTEDGNIVIIDGAPQLDEIGEIVFNELGDEYIVSKNLDNEGEELQCMFPFPVLTHTFRVIIEVAVINAINNYEVIDPREFTGEFTVELRYYEEKTIGGNLEEDLWIKEIDRVQDVSFN